MYKLLNSKRSEYLSIQPGRFGGHSKLRIYGKLDCPSALRWVAKGHYTRYRVFFSDEQIAKRAGFRPCAICMPKVYKQWVNSAKSKD